jgi:DNA-binding PadR family transcriptional regulator
MPPPPTSFLPLKPPVLEILISLAGAERHGYALLGEIETRTLGTVTLLPAQLYRYLRRLLEDGLIEESDERPAPDLDDERRRYYGITPLGRAVAEAEMRRLEHVLLEGRARLRPGEAR